MRTWTKPGIPTVPGSSGAPRIFDSATQSLIEARPTRVARLYVCGITPYDATHIGHAATYLAFDTLQRVWLDAGYRVRYAQNVTDIDDPLLERANATGVDWRELADQQVDLFRADMASLSIIPPDHYIAVTEVIDEIAEAVCTLLERGFAYRVPTDDADGDDIYFDNAAVMATGVWQLGEESNLDRDQMLALFAERGGDPDRTGKRDPLDALLWRAARDDEPSWPAGVGRGRPGWHIECSVIALKHLGSGFRVQGGGSDLIFPHHEMSVGHAAALSGHSLARLYSHAGLVSYQGEKMSKSLGNLVLVSRLRADGVDPRAIRLALLGQHYRSDWEWTDAVLADGVARLCAWQAWSTGADSGDPAAPDTVGVVEELRAALREDLDTPTALRIIDRAILVPVRDPQLLADAVRALLGIAL
ncbi:MAG: cysteine--1-D-myo-inosityl 2-amino-2-deoxy-alpha-D-glucopyranoside ligase [Microbacteriaceae bacterium]